MNIVEIRRGHHPDNPGGQHVGTGSFWVRFGQGPWRRINAYHQQSQHRLLQDLADLFELVDDNTGGGA